MKVKAKKKANQNPEIMPEVKPEVSREMIIEPKQTNFSQNEGIITDYNSIAELKAEPETDTEIKREKKRGRPKKVDSETTETFPEIDISPIIDLIIKRLPNPIPLTVIERSLFNNSANKILRKYSGEIKYIEEINAGLVLIAILYPRFNNTDNAVNNTQ